MLIQGGKSNDGNVTGLDLSTVRATNGTAMYSVINGVKIDYIAEPTQKDGGVLLASGNYANPVAGASATYVSDDAPPELYQRSGQRWWVPSEGLAYIWYEDGDSGQWVQESNAAAAMPSHNDTLGRNAVGAHDATAIDINGDESVGSYLADRNSIKMLGGAGDGATNNSAPFSSNVDYIDVAGGVFYINTDTTISADLFIKPNAVIVANNCNVTIKGDIVAGNYKVLQENGTGRFLLSNDSKLTEIRVHWYGVTLDDQSAADSNGMALSKAAKFAGSLGIPAGVYRSKQVRPPAGLLYVDDHDDDGIICPVPSYVEILGYGDNSVVRPKDGAKACDVFAVVDDGANSWSIDALQIYGEWSLQTNAQNAIHIRPPSSPAIYGYIGDKVLIKEMNGNGIKITGQGTENCEIKPRLVRDSQGHNMYVSKSRSTVFGGKYRSAKAGFWGAVFESANVVKNEINGQYDENNVGGLFLTNVGQRNEINVSASNNFSGDGVFLDRADSAIIKYIFSEQNGGRGFVTDKCDNLTGGNVTCRSNAKSGVEHYDLKDSILSNINSYFNGTLTNNTYANFLLSGDSDNNQITGLTCRGGVGTNRVAYNLKIDSQCNTNIFGDLDIRGGAVTADKLDNGINTLGLDLEASSTWDPESIPAGGLLTFDIVANKAAVGDGVDIVKFSQPLSGLILTAWVSSVNTVRVQLFNPTVGAIDLASGTITVVVDKSIRQ